MEKLPDLDDGGVNEPPCEYRYIDGLPDSQLQYIGGPRDGGITPANADMTSFEQDNTIYHYRKGISPTGRIGYLYEDYRWLT